MYATLSSSYEWNQLNRGNSLNNKIATLLKDGQIIPPSRIQTAMLTLKNRLKSPIMNKLQAAIDDGKLVMIYAAGIKVPVYLPFVITKPTPNSCVSYVFLNNLDASCAGENDEVFVNVRKLKVSLESCYIGMKIIEMGDSPKLKSTAIIRSGSKIYSNIIAECINRKHGIKIDPLIHNAILFLATKYYIFTMLGCKNMDETVMRNYCLFNCRGVEYVELQRIADQFLDDDFRDIGALLLKISNVEEFQKRLGNLTVSNFLESYINMYDASMLLGLETFNYFFFNVVNVNESTYSNNYGTLKNIVGDDGKKLYNDLIVTVSNL